MPAERLQVDTVDVREVVEIVERGEAVVPYDAVDLGLGLCLNVRIDGHEHEEVVQRGHGLRAMKEVS